MSACVLAGIPVLIPLQDNSDTQYHMVRNNIPILTVLAILSLGVKFLLQKLTSIKRTSFLFAFSIVFIFGLHGTNILKILFIMSINYLIAISLGSNKLNPVLTWFFNMGVLFAIEKNNGFSFSSISPVLAGLVRVSYSSYMFGFSFASH